MEHTFQNYKSFVIDDVLDKEDFLEVNRVLTNADAGWFWGFPPIATSPIISDDEIKKFKELKDIDDSKPTNQDSPIAAGPLMINDNQYKQYTWNTYHVLLKDIIWKVKPKFDKLVRDNFGEGLDVYTIHATGKTSGQCGGIHRDSFENVRNFAVIYFPHIDWKPEWAGTTDVYDDNFEIIDSVLPYPNRAFGFDGTYYHGGSAPALSCPLLRIGIIFKYADEKYANLEREKTIKMLKEGGISGGYSE